MPVGTNFSFFQGGGESRPYTKISIKDGILKVDKLTDYQNEPEIWLAKVSEKDLAKLYQSFIDHKFEQIKNDKPTDFVTDAGYSEITIALPNQVAITKMVGMNFPFSGKNLERYFQIRDDIFALVEKYKPK